MLAIWIYSAAQRALPPKRARTGKSDTPVSDLDNAVLQARLRLEIDVPFGEGPGDDELLSDFRDKMAVANGFLLEQVQAIWRVGDSLATIKRNMPSGKTFEAFCAAEGVPEDAADAAMGLYQRHEFGTLARLDVFGIVEEWEGILDEV